MIERIDMQYEKVIDHVVIDSLLRQAMSPRRLLLDHYDKVLKTKTAADKDYKRIIQARHIIAFEWAKIGKFITSIADVSGISIASLIDFLKDSRVVQFFKQIDWSFEYLAKLLKQGWRDLKKLAEDIEETFEHITKKSIHKALKEDWQKFTDEWKKLPKLHKYKGLVLGAILLAVWFSMPSIGDPTWDFDLSDIIDAIAGKFTLSAFLASDATKVRLVVVGLLAVSGLSFPWAISNLSAFIIAVFATLGKLVHKKVKQIRQPVENQLENLGLQPVS